MEGAHLHCVNNHYAKFKYIKKNKNCWSYRLHKAHTHLSNFRPTRIVRESDYSPAAVLFMQ